MAVKHAFAIDCTLFSAQTQHHNHPASCAHPSNFAEVEQSLQTACCVSRRAFQQQHVGWLGTKHSLLGMRWTIPRLLLLDLALRRQPSRYRPFCFPDKRSTSRSLAPPLMILSE